MKSAKVAAKPAAKPVTKIAVRKAVAANSTPTKVAAPVVTKAPQPQAPNRKHRAPATTKTAPKVVANAKAVSTIVRDSFTMNTADQELLKKCKRDAIASGRDDTRKSEIVRAALRHFACLSPETQLMELNGLDPVKTGRPKKK
jgi:hypothetical protein